MNIIIIMNINMADRSLALLRVQKITVIIAWNSRKCANKHPYINSLTRSLRSLFCLSQVHKESGKQDIGVVWNVILEVDKQHVFNAVTIATAHSREEQSRTQKRLPLSLSHTRTHTPRNTHKQIFQRLSVAKIQLIRNLYLNTVFSQFYLNGIYN